MTRPSTVHNGPTGTPTNRAALGMLHSPASRLLGGRVCGLRFAGRSTGREITLPVEYARTRGHLVILAGRGLTKTWWRNFLTPHQVQVWLDGRWQTGTGLALLTDHPDRAAALTAYRTTHSRIPPDTNDPVVTITLNPTPPPPPGARSLWLSWFIAVTVGECLGFAAPAAVGALTAHSRAAVAIPVLLLAGALEGATLGWFQARVLRRILPNLSPTSWTAATASAAALAWAIGLTPSQLGERFADLSPAVLIPAAVASGLILLSSIGTAQWFILRTRVPRAGRWIWGTALAWTVAGGLFTAVTTPLWQPGQPAIVIALIGALGGLLMAATVAALTATLLLHIVAAPEKRPNRERGSRRAHRRRQASRAPMGKPASESRQSPSRASSTMNSPASAASEAIAIAVIVPACTSGSQNVNSAVDCPLQKDKCGRFAAGQDTVTVRSGRSVRPACSPSPTLRRRRGHDRSPTVGEGSGVDGPALSKVFGIRCGGSASKGSPEHNQRRCQYDADGKRDGPVWVVSPGVGHQRGEQDW